MCEIGTIRRLIRSFAVSSQSSGADDNRSFVLCYIYVICCSLFIVASSLSSKVVFLYQLLFLADPEWSIVGGRDLACLLYDRQK